jgi:hypothetical protein
MFLAEDFKDFPSDEFLLFSIAFSSCGPSFLEGM